MEPSYNRPIALVTGASSGIGKAFSILLAKGEVFEPHDLVIVARTKHRLEELAEEIKNQYKVNTEVLVADLTTPEGVDLTKQRLRQENKPVDILINNAGFSIGGNFSSLLEDDIIAQINLNVIALTKLMHAALVQMQQRGKGYILNVSSVAGFTPAPQSATYSATKAFVTLLGESVALELKTTGINLTTLCPGFTRTEFQERAGVARDAVPSFLWQEAEAVAKEGLLGLKNNKSLVIPGVHNKVAYWALKMTPSSVVKAAAKVVTSRL